MLVTGFVAFPHDLFLYLSLMTSNTLSFPVLVPVTASRLLKYEFLFRVFLFKEKKKQLFRMLNMFECATVTESSKK